MNDRIDESELRIDGRFDTIKEWTDGVAATLHTIIVWLNEIRTRLEPAQ